MDNFLKNFPDPAELVKQPLPADQVDEVNAHIHTPYSFSAFSDVGQIFEMAVREDIKILGINDFYTMGGYPEFYQSALESKIFPLFNIEFIALDRELQKKGIRVNDPNNPGRIYFSGKGLDYPVSMDHAHEGIVGKLITGSHHQVESMVVKTNQVLDQVQAGFTLDFEEIKRSLARELVRERHIAQALRIRIFEKYGTMQERAAFLTLLYGGKEPKAILNNNSSVEIEIRNNLLKAGGRAFVEEDEKSFLGVDAVIDIIRNAGGIPCYPVLLDDPKGNYTDYEADMNQLFVELSARNISCIELIPGRNDAGILQDFVRFFSARGFIILFGTEHNTPDMVPLTVSCRHQAPLTDELKKISFEGSCLIAAHQYLRAKGTESRVSHWYSLTAHEKNQVLTLGKAVVHHFLKN